MTSSHIADRCKKKASNRPLETNWYNSCCNPNANGAIQKQDSLGLSHVLTRKNGRPVASSPSCPRLKSRPPLFSYKRLNALRKCVKSRKPQLKLMTQNTLLPLIHSHCHSQSFFPVPEPYLSNMLCYWSHFGLLYNFWHANMAVWLYEPRITCKQGQMTWA